MLIFEGLNQTASTVYQIDSLTEEEQAKGIQITELPAPEVIEGKYAVLMCRKSTNEIWYEYLERVVEDV